MKLLFASLIVGLIVHFLTRRAMEKKEANFRTLILSNYKGVWPVFPTTPWDKDVMQRAAEIERLMDEYGNRQPRLVIPFYYNNVKSLEPGEKVELDYSNFILESCRTVLREHENLLKKAHEQDAIATAKTFGGQTDWENVNYQNKPL